MKKLRAFNGEYIRALPLEEFIEACEPWLTGTGRRRARSPPWRPRHYDPAVFAAVAPLAQTRIALLSEIVPNVDFLFLDEPADRRGGLGQGDEGRRGRPARRGDRRVRGAAGVGRRDAQGDAGGGRRRARASSSARPRPRCGSRSPAAPSGCRCSSRWRCSAASARWPGSRGRAASPACRRSASRQIVGGQGSLPTMRMTRPSVATQADRPGSTRCWPIPGSPPSGCSMEAVGGLKAKLPRQYAEHDLARPSSRCWSAWPARPGRELRMSDLAAQTLLTTSGITRVVDRLERDGLVARRACPTDRRGSFAAHHRRPAWPASTRCCPATWTCSRSGSPACSRRPSSRPCCAACGPSATPSRPEATAGANYTPLAPARRRATNARPSSA